MRRHLQRGIYQQTPASIALNGTLDDLAEEGANRRFRRQGRFQAADTLARRPLGITAEDLPEQRMLVAERVVETGSRDPHLGREIAHRRCFVTVAPEAIQRCVKHDGLFKLARSRHLRARDCCSPPIPDFLERALQKFGGHVRRCRCYSVSSTRLIRFLRTVRASLPCFNARASFPKISRRHPERAFTGASSSAAIASRSSAEARSFCATWWSSQRCFKRTRKSSIRGPSPGGGSTLGGSGGGNAATLARPCSIASMISLPSLPSATPLPRLRVRAKPSIVRGACAAISRIAS